MCAIKRPEMCHGHTPYGQIRYQTSYVYHKVSESSGLVLLHPILIYWFVRSIKKCCGWGTSSAGSPFHTSLNLDCFDGTCFSDWGIYSTTTAKSVCGVRHGLETFYFGSPKVSPDFFSSWLGQWVGQYRGRRCGASILTILYAMMDLDLSCHIDEWATLAGFPVIQTFPLHKI